MADGHPTTVDPASSEDEVDIGKVPVDAASKDENRPKDVVAKPDEKVVPKKKPTSPMPVDHKADSNDSDDAASDAVAEQGVKRVRSPSHSEHGHKHRKVEDAPAAEGDDLMVITSPTKLPHKSHHEKHHETHHHKSKHSNRDQDLRKHKHHHDSDDSEDDSDYSDKDANESSDESIESDDIVEEDVSELDKAEMYKVEHADVNDENVMKLPGDVRPAESGEDTNYVQFILLGEAKNFRNIALVEKKLIPKAVIKFILDPDDSEIGMLIRPNVRSKDPVVRWLSWLYKAKDSKSVARQMHSRVRGFRMAFGPRAKTTFSIVIHYYDTEE